MHRFKRESWRETTSHIPVTTVPIASVEISTSIPKNMNPIADFSDNWHHQKYLDETPSKEQLKSRMAERPTHRRARSITSLVRRQESSGSTVLSILVSAYQVRWRHVEERLATHPSEAAVIDSGDFSILYRALSRRPDDYPPFPIVRSILRAYPQAIWERRQKMTLLEIAVRRMASLETLELLCNARPSIPEDSSAFAALWQMHCNHYETEENLINILASESRESEEIGCKLQLLLRYLTTEQLLPCTVHTAARSPNCSVELLKLFCRVFPEQIDEFVDGKLPLHYALEGASADSPGAHQVEKALYLKELRPNSIHITSAGGQLPIDLVMSAGMVEFDAVSRWTFNNHASVLGVRNPQTGLFPFETAAASHASVSSIYQLLRPVAHVIDTAQPSRCHARVPESGVSDCGPTSILLHDSPEWMSPRLSQLLQMVEPKQWDQLQLTLRTTVDPLWHQLCGAAQVFSCPPALVKLLIDMHPEKLLHEDKRGWLPLHHAVAAPQGDIREIVQYLLEACPKAAQHRDKQGLLPFHLAILRGKGTWLLQSLHRVYPDAIDQSDSFLGLPPALLAAHCPRSNISNLFYLLSNSPELFFPTRAA